MLVKELVTTMIDEDGVISVEKCGQINIYWCFKNQVIMKLYETISTTRSKVLAITEEVRQLELEVNRQLEHEKCPKFSTGGVDYDREEVLQDFSHLNARKKQKTNEYNAIKEKRWDNETINAKQLEISSQIHNLDIITDNIDILVDFLAKRCCVDADTIKKELEIPCEFQEIRLGSEIR